jgi:hypothetical protein
LAALAKASACPAALVAGAPTFPELVVLKNCDSA